ncbi:MAG TPA: hypothetical protein VNT33_14185 [Telluria sp.]|nr:hypothetical protein [Telluria sp.]
MPTQPDPNAGAPAQDISFWRLLYRFLFFDWLFADVGAARTPIERHAALQHNRRMSRYLPLYLRRWSAVAGIHYALGFLFERALQASVLSAVFFTGSCVTLTGMVVIAVSWAILAHGSVS